MQFYLILPFIVYMINKFSWSKMIIFIGIAILINFSYLHNLYLATDFVNKLIGVTIFPCLYYFLLGIFLYRNYIILNRLQKFGIYRLVCLYLILVWICYLLGFEYKGNNINPLLSIILSCGPIVFACSKPYRFQIWTRGYDLSYGMYIYHMVVINLLLQLEISSNGYMNLIIALLCSLLLALISWKVVEKPALSFKKSNGENNVRG